MIRLETYHPRRDNELLRFWNAAFSNQRNFRPLLAPEWQQRIAAPAFDPRGLILAVADDGQVVGGVHALRPAPAEGVYQLYDPRHHIAWLMVAEGWRGRGLGSYLLDQTLHGLASGGYSRVEVRTHLTKHARAYEMYTRRGFTLEDAWASLVKT